MASNEWQRRIARAEELGTQYTFAAEILRFYGAIARFQGKFYEEIGRQSAGDGDAVLASDRFARPLKPELVGRFGSFLAVVEQNGPGPIRQATRDLLDGGEPEQLQLLTAFWDENGNALRAGPNDFL